MSTITCFRNEEFAGQFGRTLQAAAAGMADLGEAYATAADVGDRYDTERWYRAWHSRAEATRTIAEQAHVAGCLRTACEAYLRSCEYYRQSYFFLRGNPDDARLTAAYAAHTAMFAKAAELFAPTDSPVRAEEVAVPYRDESGETTIHGWFLTPSSTPASSTPRRPRPTVVMPAGYDSTAESGLVYAYGALARGYNVLSVEGPGQGRSLFIDGRYMRPDYETVLSQILDWTFGRPDIDAHAIVGMGRSFAGYLLPRAAAHDSRLAALVCDPAQPDMGAKLPSGPAGRVAAPMMTAMSKLSKEKADFFGCRMAVHGVHTIAEYFAELKRYTMLDDAASITCATLIVESPGDPVGGHGRELFDALDGAVVKKYVEFDADSGVSGHCGGLGQRAWDAVVFDWLDAVLAQARRESDR